jgi:MFS transporter, ACS family, D-galactonate transporter
VSLSQAIAPPRPLVRPDISLSRVLAALMALCFISHLNRVAISVAGKERLMGQFDLTPTQMGSVYSAFLFAYTLFMIPGGLAIDRWGARRALLAMGLATAFFGAITGLVGVIGLAGAAAWSSLLVVRSCMGFATTPLHPGCARLVSQSFPETRHAWANSLITGAALLGIAATYPVVGKLIDLWDWPAALIIGAAATALVTVIFWRSTGCLQLGAAARGPAVNWNKLLRNRDLLLLTAGYAAVGYFQYLFFYWMLYYFDDVLHFGQKESRFYAGLPTLAMAFGMPVGGWLVSRLQDHLGAHAAQFRVAAGGMIGSAAFLLCGIFSSGAFLVVLFFSLSLGVLGLSEGPFWTRAVAVGGNNGGASAAFMNTGGNGIGLLAPLLTPLISQYLGWKLGLAFGAAVVFVGAICWFAMSRNSEPRSILET